MKSIKDLCSKAHRSLTNDDILGSRMTIYASSAVEHGFGIGFFTKEELPIIGPAVAMYSTEGHQILIPTREITMIKYYDDEAKE